MGDQIAIPKIIMQTWKTKTLPAHWQASQDAIRRLLVDWKYTLQTDADNTSFVSRYFPDFKATFDGFEYPIQRADAIRYMWLYVHGGVYLDLDLEIVEDICCLFKRPAHIYVVMSGIVPNVYTNAFMAAVPGQHVMLECLHLMQIGHRPWHFGKHLKVVNSTGPNMFTQAIINYKEQDEDFIVEEIPSDKIIACSICDPKPCWRPGAICRTLGGSSWSGSDTELLGRLYCDVQTNKQYLKQNKDQVTAITVVIIVFIILVVLAFKRRA